MQLAKREQTIKPHVLCCICILLLNRKRRGIEATRRRENNIFVAVTQWECHSYHKIIKWSHLKRQKRWWKLSYSVAFSRLRSQMAKTTIISCGSSYRVLAREWKQLAPRGVSLRLTTSHARNATKYGRVVNPRCMKRYHLPSFILLPGSFW